MTKVVIPKDMLNGWCDDMSIAPTGETLDIVDKYGDRYVNCYHNHNGWQGIDPAYYEPVAEQIHNPTHWMKVRMPND